jgi:hypothetical protein
MSTVKKRKKAPLKPGMKVCYAYITTTNDGWVRQKALQTGHSISEVVDGAIQAIRTGGELKLNRKNLGYVEKAQRMLAKRREKLKGFRKLSRKKVKAAGKPADNFEV